MTLTVVVGSSGSGKTTFLEDVYRSHKCIYIRQYHNIRPYVIVSKIPHFDPTKLPFWDIYVKEGTANSIPAGGTMAGEFTAGLSGGQRKLLLFELVRQRCAGKSNLLICLDEPFAGVTDDFVPFIVERLKELKENHQILLVTNDHVEALTQMADNTITVSAIDRSMVKINHLGNIGRSKAIEALSVGKNYVYKGSWADLRFFLEVEVFYNAGLMGIGAFVVVFFSLFLLGFWDSPDNQAALVLNAGSLIAFFSVNPYLISLPDWRVYMSEEAEALLHSSKKMNKALKSSICIFLFIIVSVIQFGTTNAVMNGLESYSFWVAILMDSLSMTFSSLFFGLYTELPKQGVLFLADMPFMFMIFLSTTFSPGSGIPVLKELRYLFSRFYFWCMLPGILEDMEGCPVTHTQNMIFMSLTGVVLPFLLFLVPMAISKMLCHPRKRKEAEKINWKDGEFRELQVELFGKSIIEGPDKSTQSSSFSK
ncbi:hypothetical protein FisN_18Lh287 [Fistulifera solaris]|uniref:Uncharacterized protein n=1 Tax=Fistulifera solaris TaxID=1519565 RepID=A0A1Z5JV58_FISSO|nr:hypothetical protein FisN_18Lh287 [Fistulifera solaris]|eukprot:GAX17631.1 hypothetical protein FisN_18Lh287 [Fistulifera solaris]